MATYTSNFSSGAGQLILEVTNQSYSVANNNSVIKVVMKVKKLKAYSSWNNGGATIYISVNGTKIYTNNKFDFRNLAINATQTIGEGVATISHKADGTQTCNVYGYFDTSVSFGKATSDNTYTCVNIPRGATITQAPDFNDEENPTITYSNSAGTAVSELKACISLTGAVDDIAYRNIPISGTSYTFNLTEAERNLLRNNTLNNSDTRTVSFHIKTVIDGTTFYNSKTVNFTVINCSPILNPTYSDENSVTRALTGNPLTFIKGYSHLTYNINATPQKGASIVNYWAECGKMTSDRETGTFLNIVENYLKVRARDNRNLPSEVIKQLTIIDYSDVSCSQKVEMKLKEGTETEAEIILTITGNFFNQNFGSVNNYLDIDIRYTDDDGNMGDWIRLSDFVPITYGDNNSYTITSTFGGFRYDKSYKFQSRAIDKLSSAITSEYTANINPVFDWSKTDFNFNVPVKFQGETMADMIVEEGSKNGWTYRKFKSGVAECWTTVLNTTSFNTTWGSMYQNDNAMPQLTYPFDFVEVPSEIASLVGGTGYSAWIYVDSTYRQTNKKTGVYRLCRPSQVVAQAEFKINIHCLGRWR